MSTVHLRTMPVPLTLIPDYYYREKLFLASLRAVAPLGVSEEEVVDEARLALVFGRALADERPIGIIDELECEVGLWERLRPDASSVLRRVAPYLACLTAEECLADLTYDQYMVFLEHVARRMSMLGPLRCSEEE